MVEHTPDLIEFLTNCGVILKDAGVISLVAPDSKIDSHIIEFVTDHKNGLVVDTNSELSCYTALRLLVKNDDLRRTLQMAGLRDVTRYAPQFAGYKIL